MRRLYERRDWHFRPAASRSKLAAAYQDNLMRDQRCQRRKHG